MSSNKKVAIVTDGACSITPDQGERFGLHIVPVYVIIEDQTYLAGVNLDTDEFYRLLRSSKNLPTTAQPTAQDFISLYTRLGKDVDEIITIVISHHMSATIQSVEMAMEQYNTVPIHLIDSESVSLGLGLIAIAAARAAAEGMNAQKIIRLAESIKRSIQVIFTVDTLEYLHRGGRIGGATALLGSALNIKPILYIKDGRIEPLERQRTRKKAVNRICELVEEYAGSEEIHAAVLHCGIPDEAGKFAEQISTQYDCAELHVMDAGPVIGTHAGPGTLGIVFYKSSDTSTQ